jgi:hypothetical protein
MQHIPEHLVATLQRNDLPWITSQRHDGQKGDTLRWLSIASFEEARIELGLSSTGRWVRAASESVQEFGAGVIPVFLLPILEVPPTKAIESLKGGLSRLGLPAEFLDGLPVGEVLLAAVGSHSEHWVALALEWIEGVKLDDRTRQELLHAFQDLPDQQLRHRGTRILRS